MMQDEERYKLCNVLPAFQDENGVIWAPLRLRDDFTSQRTTRATLRFNFKTGLDLEY